ncbi:hypothetical protein PCL1606_33980 [Pseudomonas chlororaphis]|uniref:Uncharacterized protein n=1 Tax=Pseudomonas chlororaphis TaxID=587753 RepID=A0A0D5Y1J6_9PSED|nr:hypothetical protein PCL1606_33980 [Pseudomonas chlororaphis]
MCSCRGLAARHTDHSPIQRRANVCRAASKRSIQVVVSYGV